MCEIFKTVEDTVVLRLNVSTEIPFDGLRTGFAFPLPIMTVDELRKQLRPEDGPLSVESGLGGRAHLMASFFGFDVRVV